MSLKRPGFDCTVKSTLNASAAIYLLYYNSETSSSCNITLYEEVQTLYNIIWVQLNSQVYRQQPTALALQLVEMAGRMTL